MNLLNSLMLDNWNIHIECDSNKGNNETTIRTAGTKDEKGLPFPISFDVEGEVSKEILGPKNTEALMDMLQEGWNILIECKGKHREFGMSFEASGMNLNQKVAYPVTYHATSDTFPGVLEILNHNKGEVNRLLNYKTIIEEQKREKNESKDSEGSQL